MDIRFGHLEYLILLWLVIGLAGLSIYAFARKRRALELFAASGLSARLTANVSRARQRVKAVLIIAGAFFLVASLIEPKWGVYWKEMHRRGRDIIIVLDVSRSMLAEDVTPSRLERAKLAVTDLVEKLRDTHGDRVALVTFAGNTSVKCPLTLDYAFFNQMLADVGVLSQARGGTMIGDAIRKATETFDDKLKNYKDVILITDGEDHDSYPIDAAKAAAEKGICVHTVGLGDPAGARIPIRQGNRGSFLEYQGQPVMSKLGEEVLQQIALQTNGAFVPARTKAFSLDEVYQQKIATKEGRETEQTRRERYTNRYQWFLAIGLILLAVEPLISERKKS